MPDHLKSFRCVASVVLLFGSTLLSAQSAETPQNARASSELHVFTNVAGTGTADQIVRWQDSGTLADSIIAERTINSTFRKVTIGVPGGVAKKLHVFADSVAADGIGVDGDNNPAVVLRNGVMYGYVGLATNSGGFLTNSHGGDLVLRSDTGNVLLGRSGGASALIVTGANVGIGRTTDPQLTLDVMGTALSFGSARRVIRVTDDSNTECPTTCTIAGVGGGIDFRGKYSTIDPSLYVEYANVKGVKANATSGDQAGRFVVSINSSGGGMTEKLAVDSAGATVTGNLTATGDITATGNITGARVINAVYQDVAEWVPATAKMAPGTVVVLNRDRRNEVMPSAEPYDTAVAGVVSEQPGVVLGVASESKAQIATTGRVKVHVDATAGAIRIGDLLVTSAVPGTAMKSNPVDVGGVQMHRPGTVIGKALEPLASGEGEILVLLSLQ